MNLDDIKKIYNHMRLDEKQSPDFWISHVDKKIYPQSVIVYTWLNELKHEIQHLSKKQILEIWGEMFGKTIEDIPKEYGKGPRLKGGLINDIIEHIQNDPICSHRGHQFPPPYEIIPGSEKFKWAFSFYKKNVQETKSHVESATWSQIGPLLERRVKIMEQLLIDDENKDEKLDELLQVILEIFSIPMKIVQPTGLDLDLVKMYIDEQERLLEAQRKLALSKLLHSRLPNQYTISDFMNPHMMSKIAEFR
tara:strand:+ start:1274 stop:2023 length:750 start_codon:yes stop_codon:yes gene_type:complete